MPPVAARGAIVLENAAVLVLALWLGWTTTSLLWIYWWQSVVIGVFAVLRILALRRFSTEGFSSNGERVPETEKGKRSTAVFFCVHYGLFHLGYLVFLTGFGAVTSVGLLPLLVSIASFAWGHGTSWRRNVAADLDGKPNLGTLMFLPYARIVPMHLLIILGGFVPVDGLLLALFIALKTGADLLMHEVEHRILRRSRAS